MIKATYDRMKIENEKMKEVLRGITEVLHPEVIQLGGEKFNRYFCIFPVDQNDPIKRAIEAAKDGE